MNKEQKPEALQPAEKLRDAINRIELGFSDAIATNDLRLAAMELESLHPRVQELEAKEAKSAAPVVLPGPVAWMLGYQTMGGDVGWKLSFSQSGAGVCQRLQGEELEKRLYTEQQVRELLAQATCHQAQPVKQEPFGYFKPFVDGWMDCKETDEGARPLYEAPQPQADELDAARGVSESVTGTSFLQEEDQQLLDRFIETTEDNEGFDIGKDAIKRLANIGVVESLGFGQYCVTMFGYWVHEHYWHQSPSLPLKTNADRDANARAAIAKATGAESSDAQAVQGVKL